MFWGIISIMRNSHKSTKDLKVLITTDWMASPGGADRLVEALVDIFPSAEVLTTVFFPENYEYSEEYVSKIKTTFIQKLPFVRKIYRYFNSVAYMGFENYDTSGYDMVISVSAGVSKRIVTDYRTPHIGIILTPPRFLWDGELNVGRGLLRKLLSPVALRIRHTARIYDYIYAQKIDYMIAISQYISQKIEKYYRRTPDEVIYPCTTLTGDVETAVSVTEGKSLPEEFFLVVARHYDYKNIATAIRAGIKTGKHLLITGRGPATKRLKRLAKGHDNIYFTGHVSDSELIGLYRQAQAVVFPTEEDFGLVTVEALSYGCPVIGYDRGAIREVLDFAPTDKPPCRSKYGYIFHTTAQLADIMDGFESTQFRRDALRRRAELYGRDEFVRRITEAVDKVVKRHGMENCIADTLR